MQLLVQGQLPFSLCARTPSLFLQKVSRAMMSACDMSNGAASKIDTA